MYPVDLLRGIAVVHVAKSVPKLDHVFRAVIRRIALAGYWLEAWGGDRTKHRHQAVQGAGCSGSPKPLRLACVLSAATGAHCKPTRTDAPNRIDP